MRESIYLSTRARVIARDIRFTNARVLHERAFLPTINCRNIESILRNEMLRAFACYLELLCEIALAKDYALSLSLSLALSQKAQDRARNCVICCWLTVAVSRGIIYYT